jgi:hypothetical protein
MLCTVGTEGIERVLRCVVVRFGVVRNNRGIAIDVLHSNRAKEMSVVVEVKNTADALLMNATKKLEDSAVVVHVRLMFLRIGKLGMLHSSRSHRIYSDSMDLS